ncbi:uncharacterized protein [Ptychodera flava]|uniref:uncharacterized protein n=1 Tax=Ptychodera flava TaxID=63121 RepID=UPI003969F5C7
MASLLTQRSDMENKKRIVVFTKLESFRNAAEKVKQKLQDVFHGDVQILSHTDSNRNTCNLESVTAVVVIDARQTRTLITPERRDRNVDHWDELHMLSTTVTDPRDSILIVIYGDEASRYLTEDEYVADRWKTTWKYNDDIAYHLTSNQRCFTIWDNFNKLQAEQIRSFTLQAERHTYKFFQDACDVEGEDKSYSDRHFNAIVIGRELFDSDSDPHFIKSDSVKLVHMDIMTYCTFQYKHDKSRKPSITIYQTDGVAEHEFSDSDKFMQTFTSVIENMKDSISSAKRAPRIDCTIILVHSQSCREIVSTQKSRICNHLNKALGKKSKLSTENVFVLLPEEASLSTVRHACCSSKAPAISWNPFENLWPAGMIIQLAKTGAIVAAWTSHPRRVLVENIGFVVWFATIPYGNWSSTVIGGLLFPLLSLLLHETMKSDRVTNEQAHDESGSGSPLVKQISRACGKSVKNIGMVAWLVAILYANSFRSVVVGRPIFAILLQMISEPRSAESVVNEQASDDLLSVSNEQRESGNVVVSRSSKVVLLCHVLFTIGICHFTS